MNKRSIIWQIFPAHFLVTVLSIAIVTFLATGSVKNFYIDNLKSDLVVRANLVSTSLPVSALTDTSFELNSTIKSLRDLSACRITIIDGSGLVVADSDKNPDTMENHADRPEIVAAFQGSNGWSVRHSPTLNQMMMYVAIPLSSDSSNNHVIRVSLPLGAVESVLQSVYARIVISGTLIMVLTALLSFQIARQIRKPIEQIRYGADLIARGENKRILIKDNSLELSHLTDSLNLMAKQLEDRIEEVTYQRNELRAILESMIECVIVVNESMQIVRLNRAAIDLFGISLEQSHGLLLQEVIRAPALQNLVVKVLDGRGYISEDVSLLDGQKLVQAHGSIIIDSERNELGALIVLNDVTELRRLEMIRKEFVANVSHELRTPITSIKGFIETLQEGALKDEENAQKFLDIVSRKIDHLNETIDDLMTLARIEADSDSNRIKLITSSLSKPIEKAVNSIRELASERRVTITTGQIPDIDVEIAPNLIAHAVGNLIDNAVRYSEPESEVNVSVGSEDSKVQISVEDSGCGIAEENLPRLFERFYRVDKDRGQLKGGTGLGLAIVKHIALAHNGTVDVNSEVGKGSVFRIILPI